MTGKRATISIVGYKLTFVNTINNPLKIQRLRGSIFNEIFNRIYGIYEG